MRKNKISTKRRADSEESLKVFTGSVKSRHKVQRPEIASEVPCRRKLSKKYSDLNHVNTSDSTESSVVNIKPLQGEIISGTIKKIDCATVVNQNDEVKVKRLVSREIIKVYN